MTGWARVAAAACALLLLSLPACRSGPDAATPPVAAPPPAYEAIAEVYNARAARLERMWSRAVVQLRYLDEDGRRRSVQGEGHLQVIQPNRLALSAGKLGETLFWLGGDSERFWAFELGDASRASVGRHENVGRPCARSLAAPVHPLEALDLLGITALPASPAPVAWSEDGQALVIEFPGRFGPQRVFVDPVDYLPTRIELLDPRDGAAAIVATLEQHERVSLAGSPGYNPRVATRIVIEHPGSESEVRLTLSDMTDGSGRGRLAEAVFAFESLLRAFRPDEIVVLDEACDRPAYAAAPGATR
ncbi:MAG: hypothetical protein ACF8QF_05705 [Phycisphaerales bacterium]